MFIESIMKHFKYEKISPLTYPCTCLMISINVIKLLKFLIATYIYIYLLYFLLLHLIYQYNITFIRSDPVLPFQQFLVTNYLLCTSVLKSSTCSHKCLYITIFYATFSCHLGVCIYFYPNTCLCIYIYSQFCKFIRER